MPTTLVAVSNFDMQWMEPYASAGLNRKNLGAVATGVYRGFKLSSDGLGGTPILTISADAVYGDHIAVVQTADGNYSLLCRQTGGTFTVDMTAMASTTQVVCVSASYAVGSTTTANVVAYLLSDYNALSASAKLALAVLGTVTVPAIGNAIPTTAVVPDRRTMAWEGVAGEAIAWAPLFLNPSFEIGPSGVAGNEEFQASYWESNASGVGSWIIATGAANTGAHSMQLTTSGLGATTGYLYQYLGIPCLTGRRIKMTGAVKLTHTVNSGTVSAQIEFLNETGAIGATNSVTLSLPAAGAGWTSFETWFTVPASVYAIKTAGIKLNALALALSGGGIDFDDVQLFMEVPPHDASPLASRTGQVYSSGLIVKDPTALYSAIKGLLTFDSTTPASEGRVLGQRWDLDGTQLPPQLQWLGRGEFGGGLLESSAQAVGTPRLQTTLFASGWTLIWKTINGSGVVDRIYADSAGALYFTTNVSYNNTNFVKDVAGDAQMVKIGGSDGVLTMFRKGATISEPPATFTTWDLTNPLQISARNSELFGPAGLGQNGLSPKNITKGWLSLVGDVSGSLLQSDSYHMASFVSISSTPGYIQVTWSNASFDKMTVVSAAFYGTLTTSYVAEPFELSSTQTQIFFRKANGTLYAGLPDVICSGLNILMVSENS